MSDEQNESKHIVVDIGAAFAALQDNPELAQMMNELVGGPALVEAQAALDEAAVANAALQARIAALEGALTEQVAVNRLLMKDAGLDEQAVTDSTSQARAALHPPAKDATDEDVK